MKFKSLTGSFKTVPKVKKYLIDWKGSSRSKLQRSVKIFLKDYWSNYIIFEEFPVAGTKMTFDFYNANKKIAIEVQGQQHLKFTPFFHTRRSNFASQIRRDEQKLEFCNINNIKLVEIYPSDTLSLPFFQEQGVFL
jgi:hypothetical protein